MWKDFMAGLRRWVESDNGNRRNTLRTPEPSVVVYYWDGGSAPEARRLRDISATGAYILTPERWYIGTIVRLILQEFKTAPPDSGLIPSKSTSLLSRVVRHGPDGVAVEFLFASSEEREALDAFRKSIPKTTDAMKQGQALIEFALVLPLLFLLMVNTINFGGFFFAWVTIANAARAGTQYMIRSGATVGTPTPATAAQVSALVTSDISSLPNRASLVVRICTNNNGVVACSGSGSGTPLSDPEPASYVLGSVDVTYTYRPFIPLWNFPLGIHATLPTTAIHRQMSMRMLQ
jgi:Flp pilus assembly protein TadG